MVVQAITGLIRLFLYRKLQGHDNLMLGRAINNHLLVLEIFDPYTLFSLVESFVSPLDISTNSGQRSHRVRGQVRTEIKRERSA